MIEPMAVKEFWQRLDASVRAKNTSYSALGSDLGFSAYTLYNDRSKQLYPRLSTLVKMCNHLNVSIDWLVFGEEKGIGYSETDLDMLRVYSSAPSDVKNIVSRILSKDWS